MVSTTFNRETVLSVDLPEADGMEKSEQKKLVEVVIGADGNYAVNNKPLVDNKLETVLAAIKKTSEGDNTLPVVITADRNAPHHAVVTAMDAAGQLGFIHLSITTQKTASDS